MSTGPSPASVHPGPVCPSEATRPPVTRVKSGVWERSRQHELSAIPEVETTFNPSLDTGQHHPHGTIDTSRRVTSEPCYHQRNGCLLFTVITCSFPGWENSLRLSSHGADQGLLEDSPPLPAGGRNIWDKSSSSESSSGSSSHLLWTERALRSSQSSPQGASLAGM